MPVFPGPTRRPFGNWRVAAASALLALGAAGCSTLPDPYLTTPAAEALGGAGAQSDCIRLLHAIDQKIDAAGLRDNQSIRIAGYPYLRADRYTVRNPIPDNGWRAAAEGRVDRMAALDVEARSFELANLRLSAAERAEAERCRAELVAAARADPAAPAAAARVPDDYNDSLRVLGLYPLMRLPFAGGVNAWQGNTREVFRTSFPDLKVEGQRIRYVPGNSPRPTSLAGWLPPGTSGASQLGTPALSLEQVWQLAQRHAPVLVVDTVSEADRIGALRWSVPGAAARVIVDPAQRAGYARLAWTEIDGKVVAQLIYTFWFVARSPEHFGDIEAGPIDGLIWRVTLGADLRPLVYDSIHASGAFQMFFPTERVRERPQPIDGESFLDDGRFVPQFLRAPAPQERVAVYLSARAHQIQRVAVEAAPSAPGLVYQLLDENTLRALPLPGGGVSRSVYGPDMRIAGTERAERWFYWPMGIESPGQQRQWGHHATALVGRRQFDDPFLFDRYFSLAPRHEVE